MRARGVTAVVVIGATVDGIAAVALSRAVVVVDRASKDPIVDRRVRRFFDARSTRRVRKQSRDARAVGRSPRAKISSRGARAGVAQSQTDATFYHFHIPYLIPIKVYPNT